MTRFLLIRHATNDTVGKSLPGRSEGVTLNDEGRQQAQQLAQRIARLKISAVYSSPLERAMLTASPIADSHHLEIQTSDAFLEIDFGEWTNQSFEALQQQPQFNLFNTFRSNTRIPGGELMLEAQSRIVSGLQTLAHTHENQTVVVVSHADMIKAAISYYLGIHLDLFHRIEISPASVSVVDLFPDTARIVLVNHTGDV